MLGPASLVPVSLASAIFRMPPPGTPCKFCCQIGVLALPCRLFCRFDGAARLCISLARLSSLLRAAATICACVGPLPFAILTPGLKFGLLVSSFDEAFQGRACCFLLLYYCTHSVHKT